MRFSFGIPGLFTGSTLGCITALINYLGARKQFLDSLYDDISAMMVELYGAKAILKSLISLDYSTLDYATLRNRKSDIEAIYDLAIKIEIKHSRVKYVGYNSLLFKKKINYIVGQLNKISLSGILDFNRSSNKHLRNYLTFLIDASPRDILVYGGEVTNVNRYDYDAYKLQFKSGLQDIDDNLSNMIEEVGKEMLKLDRSQNATNLKWSKVQEAFDRVLISK